MKIHSWRIVKHKHLGDAFSGEGARLFGGRWNSPGMRTVYTAQHASLAVLEVLVHLEASGLMAKYVLLEATFDDALVESLQAPHLPKKWRDYPPPLELRAMGDRWLREKRSAVLDVPSALVPMERLFLLNPEHPDFKRIRIGHLLPFDFDARLAKRV